MSRQVEILKYKGDYPVQMKKEYLGIDMNREGEECYEWRVYMYLGSIRLDITDKKPDEVKMIVRKLELMGMTND
jgi:hypothetical protein